MKSADDHLQPDITKLIVVLYFLMYPTLPLSPSRTELHIGQRISSIRSCPLPRRKHPPKSIRILSGLRGRSLASSYSVFSFFPWIPVQYLFGSFIVAHPSHVSQPR